MEKSTNTIRCIGCGALVADIDGPTFSCPDAASPRCWAVFGEILATEYGSIGYPDVHRLMVDTCAAQHPGRPTTRTTQSVTVHLISPSCVLERGYSLGQATKMMRQATNRYKGRSKWLPPPESHGAVTMLDVGGQHPG